MTLRSWLLRLVLVAYGVAHLVTATLFLGWPDFFVTGTGAVPPWPLNLFQFGAWPPLHQGFMNVLAVYDVAVATGLFIAATNPLRHWGILVFAAVLWTLHGATHAYHIVWGSSPSGYWSTVAELWAGAGLIAALSVRAGVRGPASNPHVRGS